MTTGIVGEKEWLEIKKGGSLLKLGLKSKKNPVVEILEEPEHREKVSKIKTDGLMKGGRIILWTVIIFLLLRGIFSIISPGGEVRMERIVDNYRADAKLREAVQVEAAAFAEDFAYEYYTFSGEMNSDYQQRLADYLADNLEIKNPVSGNVSAEVVNASVTRIKYISDMDFDIDVHLTVIYTPRTEGGAKTQKDIYLRIPVSKDSNSRYAVTSYPSYIPKVPTGKIKEVNSYAGNPVPSSQLQRIKDTLNSFFKAYYSGTKTEISYYLSGSNEVANGIGGKVEFDKIQYILVYKDESTGDYLADTSITVVDNGQQMQQRLFLRLQYSKNRYYIKNISTRPI